MAVNCQKRVAHFARNTREFYPKLYQIWGGSLSPEWVAQFDWNRWLTLERNMYAFTKNNSRNEWLLEKTTELGVSSIIPLVSSRSEKTHIRHDRWHKILQSAILQSQQYYLPWLSEITPLQNVLKQYSATHQKLVAHCIPGLDRRSLQEMLKPAKETILLIGPEGDFTQDEVNLCTKHGFIPVSMGTQRLRTETAAISAAACFNLIFDEKG